MSPTALYSLIGITVFFGMLVAGALVAYRHNPRLRMIAILGISAIESIMLGIWVILYMMEVI